MRAQRVLSYRLIFVATAETQNTPYIRDPIRRFMDQNIIIGDTKIDFGGPKNIGALYTWRISMAKGYIRST